MIQDGDDLRQDISTRRLSDLWASRFTLHVRRCRKKQTQLVQWFLTSTHLSTKSTVHRSRCTISAFTTSRDWDHQEPLNSRVAYRKLARNHKASTRPSEYYSQAEESLSQYGLLTEVGWVVLQGRLDRWSRRPFVGLSAQRKLLTSINWGTKQTQAKYPPVMMIKASRSRKRKRANTPSSLCFTWPAWMPFTKTISHATPQSHIRLSTWKSGVSRFFRP